MATLDSSSTRDQVLGAYADNVSYFEDASVAKARAFVTACGLLLSPKFSVTRAKHSGRGGGELEYSPELIQGRLDRAESWLIANDTSRTGTAFSPIHSDISNMRGR